MMDPATAYFLKKYYPHVIKWWLVAYNPETVRIWPSKAERDEALLLEEIEAKKEAEKKAKEEAEQLALGNSLPELEMDEDIDDSAFNATTGSYSGLYGKKPVDESTQAALDAIMNASNKQNSVDFLLAGTNSSDPNSAASLLASTASDDNVVLPPE